MDISGINNNIINTTMDNAKSKVQTGNFENALKKAYGDKDKQELKKVCKQFEQMLMNMMFKEMRATVKASESEGSSFARDTYQEMLDNKLIENEAEGKGIGLADMLYKNLVKQMDSTYTTAKSTDENTTGDNK